MLSAGPLKYKLTTSELVIKLIQPLLFVFLLTNNHAFSYCTTDNLQLGGRLTAPYHTDKGEGLIDQHVQLIFDGLNCKVQLLTIPSERSLRNSNRGLLDGDFIQLSDLNLTLYSNLIQVNPSYFSFFMAYVSLQNITYADKDLSGYRIGAMIGMPLSDQSLNDVKVVRTKSYDQLITLLQRKRIDIAVLPIAVAYYYQKQTCLTQLHIEVKPELKVKLHIYLHKKHQALVEPLSKEIEGFKHSRKYQKLMRHFLKKGLNISAPKCD
ncbi:transporter substrate-binding domain-containing protein [Endozoicomonas sp. SM1973]|uniref:Transporter substrate-binding domain-containing protein n=1 Tax=Spartinivicinus marinus TaxID=2994442 RepID=A0A853I7C7_9GAMM|nr:transporter substrate-binding domain-containing protein [Spartinivicinus marinus]MCX4027374.1 transporter substrate-binding domain-containing protein [Spartinivicinus marinus]NYZ69223.1 transporter substrate-binding domain-containing protein [Spartinivicinus marinus]